MKIAIAELRAVANMLFDHLERPGHTEITVDADFYWSIPKEQLYSVDRAPTSLTIGQLSDDYCELRRIQAGAAVPIAYGMVWLSTLLRYIGACVVC
ncbi:MAG TPA: hypothetical protein PLA94_12130 [Myxococcota bacterium]|nr:hypothetical protein [Myxococcota bacterium]